MGLASYATLARVFQTQPVTSDKSIMGHSMGGHGLLKGVYFDEIISDGFFLRP